jgi:hypothetical protein
MFNFVINYVYLRVQQNNKIVRSLAISGQVLFAKTVIVVQIICVLT